MRMVTGDAFERARAYLFTHGRPLDRERFRFHFAAGSAAAVMAELAAYQNDDGGFGHALEPDVRFDGSSPIATAMAFHVLREIGLPDGDMVRRALAYLAATFDKRRKVWQMVPPAVESAPHAPWWTYADLEATFGGFLVNPTADILGALYDYAGHVPADLLSELTPQVADRAQAMPDPIDHNAYTALVRLAEARNLPEPVREPLRDRLRRGVRGAVALDPSTWDEYSLEPLAVLGTPNSFLAGAVSADAVEADIEHWIDSQLPDGSWPLTWNWSFVDGQAWAQAERDWKGQVIVDKLVALRAFGRV